jgi:hypothetical protein
MKKFFLVTAALIALTTNVFAESREVPTELQGVAWCNKYDACILFGRTEMIWSTSWNPCIIHSITEKPAHTYVITNECGKVHVETFILQTPDKLVQRYWEKQPVGHWENLVYTRNPISRFKSYQAE